MNKPNAHPFCNQPRLCRYHAVQEIQGRFRIRIMAITGIGKQRLQSLNIPSVGEVLKRPNAQMTARDAGQDGAR